MSKRPATKKDRSFGSLVREVRELGKQAKASHQIMISVLKKGEHK